MSEVAVSLGAGAIGALITIGAAAGSRFLAARREIVIHDDLARERNERLEVWVDVETKRLIAQVAAIRDEMNGRGILFSSIHDGERKKAKEDALLRYRDERSRAWLDLAALRAREGYAHWLWRRLLHRPALSLTADVESVIDWWRAPMPSSMQGSADITPIDATKRPTVEALRQLPGLALLGNAAEGGQTHSASPGH
jgi:hypothetical protein